MRGGWGWLGTLGSESSVFKPEHHLKSHNTDYKRAGKDAPSKWEGSMLKPLVKQLGVGLGQSALPTASRWP